VLRFFFGAGLAGAGWYSTCRVAHDRDRPAFGGEGLLPVDLRDDELLAEQAHVVHLLGHLDADQLVADRRHGLQATRAGTPAHSVEQVRFPAKLRLDDARPSSVPSARARQSSQSRACKRGRIAPRTETPSVGCAG
jgi:hypothetical protein